VHCFSHSDGKFPGAGLFTETCPEADGVRFTYSVFAMVATLLYFALTIDLSVFSTRVSAFVLVCFLVLSEVGLFLIALGFFILMFSSAVSALDHGNAGFSGIPVSALSLLKVTFGILSGEKYDGLHSDPALMMAIFSYIIVTVVFLVNLLIAQLNSSYQSTYQDMVGFARLNRGKIVTEAMMSVTTRRWERFISSLHLEDPCEFGEGDIGLAGGIQVLEPAAANITTVDMIRRFGGSTSPAAQWPEEDLAGDDEDDRFEKMERLIEKAMKRMTSSGGSSKRKGGGGTALGSSVEYSSADHDATGGASGSGSEHGTE